MPVKRAEVDLITLELNNMFRSDFIFFVHIENMYRQSSHTRKNVPTRYIVTQLVWDYLLCVNISLTKIEHGLHV